MVVNSKYLSFAGLFFVQNLSRGLLLSIIPIKALLLFGDAQRISVLLFVASLGGILAALAMPKIINAVGHYRAFLFGSGVMLFSFILLSLNDPLLFSLGLFCQVFSIASAEVSYALYTLARVPRNEMTQFEPLRACFTVFALTIGPFTGVWMAEAISVQAPFIVSAVFVISAVIYFRRLKLHETAMTRSDSISENPFRYLTRYMKQPRLRLAYGLVCARSSWWLMFVIYTPIYLVEMGVGELVAAAVVSIGCGWTLSVPFWGWVGRKYGVQVVLLSGFIMASIFSALVFFASPLPMLAAVLLIIAALGTTMLDGVGNVLFYRAVKGKERSQMAAVFVTYRDLGSIVTPGAFAGLLKLFPLPIVFLTASVWMAVAAWHCRYIPKQMK